MNSLGLHCILVLLVTATCLVRFCLVGQGNGIVSFHEFLASSLSHDNWATWSDSS